MGKIKLRKEELPSELPALDGAIRKEASQPGLPSNNGSAPVAIGKESRCCTNDHHSARTKG
jgi:hypothetical protein